MAGKPKQQEEESGEGAPLWIISFADMTSLLMAFFVMLSTFSSFGPAESATLRGVAKAVLAPNYGWLGALPRASMLPKSPAAGRAEQGSEKPTLEETSGSSGSLGTTEPKDFRTHKVFLIESEKVFWGSGTTLSGQGRDFLKTLALFASRVPSRVVISESGPGNATEQGISRAIVVMEYLCDNGVVKGRCNISEKGTLPKENFMSERKLEITLLDESTYN